MSRGLRLLSQGSDSGDSGSSKCVSEGVPAHSPCREPPLRLLPVLSALAGPATSPVSSRRHEVHTAVHPGVGDVALAGDEDLLLQVLLILCIDIAQDGVPAGQEMDLPSGLCPGATPASLSSWVVTPADDQLTCSPRAQDLWSCMT